jgi:hypothetical protein
MINERPVDATEATSARRYIETFRRHTLPGTKWVDTGERRIVLDNMTDADAVFVAREFQRMEMEAATRRKGGRSQPVQQRDRSPAGDL